MWMRFLFHFAIIKRMARFLGKLSGIRTVLQKARFSAILYIISFQAFFYAHTALADRIESPILGQNFGEVVQNIADQARAAALIIAPIFVVIAGLQFLFAGESEQKVSQAKKTLWWTLIGAAIVVGASLLTEAVINTVIGL